MIKARVIETSTGITGADLTQDYDLMQRTLRDRGLLETKDIIKSGITTGRVLEIGSGPGYLGLEWLKQNPKASLYWLEISKDMIKLAMNNAQEYGLKDKISIKQSDANQKFPFESGYFDAVFTCGMLHEIDNPLHLIDEINRVLKFGGRFYIGDFKRDTNPLIALVMQLNTKSRSMKAGLKTSINAAYTKAELKSFMDQCKLRDYAIKANAFGLAIYGKKG